MVQTASRAFAVAALACVVFALAFVQLGSDALYTGRLPHAFGVAVYHVLDRVAPASYVEDTLANEALDRGDTDAAQHYAVRMPAGPRRDDLLARIALARGQTVLANEYFFVADDIAALQQRVADLSRQSVPQALALESEIRSRLKALRTHPDAVAESYWISGNLRALSGDRVTALRDYRQAEHLTPLDVKYILAIADDALEIGDLNTAQRAFVHGEQVAPGSGDMPAGLGLVALRRGDRAAARADLEQAQRIGPDAPLVRALEAALQ
jgi:tetratricopeptide (TPR) repeat protein